MRKTYELLPNEYAQFKRLQPIPGEAVSFWKRMAWIRKLDPETVISSSTKFTALPLGHGKHWCFPVPLLCKYQPVYKE